MSTPGIGNQSFKVVLKKDWFETKPFDAESIIPTTILRATERTEIVKVFSLVCEHKGELFSLDILGTKDRKRINALKTCVECFIAPDTKFYCVAPIISRIRNKRDYIVVGFPIIRYPFKVDGCPEPGFFINVEDTNVNKILKAVSIFK